ncbi:hypothetical protein Hdeb2414_s0001g00018471 [Helianthus debilis subsp. tardiflorus]
MWERQGTRLFGHRSGNNQLHSGKQPQFQAVRVSVRLEGVRGVPVTIAAINQPHIGDQPQF